MSTPTLQEIVFDNAERGLLAAFDSISRPDLDLDASRARVRLLRRCNEVVANFDLKTEEAELAEIERMNGQFGVGA